MSALQDSRQGIARFGRAADFGETAGGVLDQCVVEGRETHVFDQRLGGALGLGMRVLD
jgi:hypothetical protein